MLTGCRSLKKTEQTVTEHTRSESDSTHFVETIRKADITIPADTATGQIKLPVEPGTIPEFREQFKSDEGRATATVKLKGNILSVACECEEWKAKIDELKREMWHYKNRESHEKETRKKDKQVEPVKWGVGLTWIGAILLVLIIIGIIKKVL